MITETQNKTHILKQKLSSHSIQKTAKPRIQQQYIQFKKCKKIDATQTCKENNFDGYNRMNKQQYNCHTNDQVYELLQSIKLKKLNKVSNDNEHTFVEFIRLHLNKLKQNDKIGKQVINMELLLNKMEIKLNSINQNNIGSVSPIKVLTLTQQKQPKNSELNISYQIQNSDIKLEEMNEEVDQLEYYKIMHLLGEKYQMSSRKHQRESRLKAQLDNQNTKKVLDSSLEITQLNIELQMLQAMLKQKKLKSIGATTDEKKNDKKKQKGRKQTIKVELSRKRSKNIYY